MSLQLILYSEFEEETKNVSQVDHCVIIKKNPLVSVHFCHFHLFLFCSHFAHLLFDRTYPISMCIITRRMLFCFLRDICKRNMRMNMNSWHKFLQIQNLSNLAWVQETIVFIGKNWYLLWCLSDISWHLLSLCTHCSLFCPTLLSVTVGEKRKKLGEEQRVLKQQSSGM